MLMAEPAQNDESEQRNPDFENSVFLTAHAPRWLIITITVVATISFLASMIVGVFWPRWFQYATAKFFVCVSLAFCFAIVMFAIYPQAARMKNIPWLNLPVELVGPPSLFIIALLLLRAVYPDPKIEERFYMLREGKESLPLKLQLASLKIEAITGKCAYYPASHPNSDTPELSGMYVEFNGNSDRCKASIGNAYVTYTFTFDREAETNVVKSE
jgi:hypothetical protein